ncbi:hypothetical protein ACWIGI_41390 [Nocardia sp. NPDC055321]
MGGDITTSSADRFGDGGTALWAVLVTAVVSPAAVLAIQLWHQRTMATQGWLRDRRGELYVQLLQYQNSALGASSAEAAVLTAEAAAFASDEVSKRWRESRDHSNILNEYVDEHYPEWTDPDNRPDPATLKAGNFSDLDFQRLWTAREAAAQALTDRVRDELRVEPREWRRAVRRRH